MISSSSGEITFWLMTFLISIASAAGISFSPVISDSFKWETLVTDTLKPNLRSAINFRC